MARKNNPGELTGSIKQTKEEKKKSSMGLKRLRERYTSIVLSIKKESDPKQEKLFLELKNQPCQNGGDGFCQHCHKFRGYIRIPYPRMNTLFEGFCDKNEVDKPVGKTLDVEDTKKVEAVTIPPIAVEDSKTTPKGLKGFTKTGIVLECPDCHDRIPDFSLAANQVEHNPELLNLKSKEAIFTMDFPYKVWCKNCGKEDHFLPEWNVPPSEGFHKVGLPPAELIFGVPKNKKEEKSDVDKI